MMAPVVTALQAMRGVALVVAVTVVADVAGFRRFANARQADGLSRPRAVRTFVRRRHTPRRHASALHRELCLGRKPRLLRVLLLNIGADTLPTDIGNPGFAAAEPERRPVASSLSLSPPIANRDRRRAPCRPCAFATRGSVRRRRQ